MPISRSFHLGDSKLWLLFRHHLPPQGCESPFPPQEERGHSNEGGTCPRSARERGAERGQAEGRAA